MHSSNAAHDVHIALTGDLLGLFAKDERQFTQSLVSTVGLRVDRNGNAGTHWRPRAALTGKATEITPLKDLYGRANRAPNAHEGKFDNGVDQTAFCQ